MLHLHLLLPYSNHPYNNLPLYLNLIRIFFKHFSLLRLFSHTKHILVPSTMGTHHPRQVFKYFISYCSQADYVVASSWSAGSITTDKDLSSIPELDKDTTAIHSHLLSLVSLLAEIILTKAASHCHHHRQ